MSNESAPRPSEVSPDSPTTNTRAMPIEKDNAFSLNPEEKPRLIPTIVDHYAIHNPRKVFASIPANDNDLSQGFRDITYLELRKAVDKAAYWLEEKLGRSPMATQIASEQQRENERDLISAFPTFAFYGGRDLRYSILAIAAMKAGYKMLSPSLLCAMNAHVRLVQESDCRQILCTPTTLPLAEDIINNLYQSDLTSKLPSSKRISTTIVPEMIDFLPTTESAHPTEDDSDKYYPFSKSWNEACNDPCLIIHTSGSSGMPKLVYYTMRMLAGPVSHAHLPPLKGQLPTLSEWSGRRIFTTVPPFHLLGYAGFLVCPIYFDSVGVMAPPHRAIDASLADEMHRYARMDGGMYFPSLLQDIVRDEHKRQELGKLQIIFFSGSPLETKTGQWLASSFGTLRNVLGSTECFAWPTATVIDPVKDWDYVHFHPIKGVEFKPVGLAALNDSQDDRGENEITELYELIAHRTPDTETFTNIFQSYPHVSEWPTKDLWRPHPDPAKEGHWLYQGRTDDLVVLSGEIKMYAAFLEDKISSSHPSIRAALIGGNQRKWPFLLLELMEPVTPANTDSDTTLDEIWSHLDEINNQYTHGSVRLHRSLTLVAEASRPFVRLAKGSVARNQTFELYKQDVDELYANMEK